MGNTLREWPVTALRSSFDGLERVASKLPSPFRSRDEDDDDEQRRRPWWHWLWLIPAIAVYWLFRLGLAIITFPVRAWFFPRRQRNCYLRGLPALLVALSAVLAIAAYVVRQDRFLSRYISIAQQSISRNEPMIGKQSASRFLTESSERRQENTFLYAVILARSGDEPLARAVLATIAPDDELGYAPAHKSRAAELAQRLEQEPEEATLEQLRWHLEQSGTNRDERVLPLWARYHQATGEFEQAAAELKEAGLLNPIYYMSLWEMEERRGNAKGAAEALEKAREGFAEQINENPLSKVTRLQLALVLTKQNRVQDAERVLLAGLQLHRDADMQNAVSDFYVLRFDTTSNEAPVMERLALLTRALSANLNNRALYVRLVQLFRKDWTDEERKSVRGLLEELLVSGANPAIAHFGLGFLNLLDPAVSTQGAWHLKQAITLQPAFAVACSNLAIVLMQHEPPRLDEAVELARQAVAASPKTALFHETLGSVLLARKEWAEAVQELNLALESGGNAKPIHGKLAEAYEGLGQSDDAQRHRELAE